MNPNLYSIRACKASILLFAICTSLLAPLIPAIGAEFGLRLQGCGALFLVFYAGNFLACAFSGKLMGHFGKPAILKTAMVAMTVLSAGVAVSPTFPAACFFLFFLGSATLIVQVAGTSIPSALAQGASASAVSGTMAFSALGSCAGLLWSGLLISAGASWRVSYLLFTGLSLIVSFLIAQTAFPPMERQKTGGMQEILTILRKRKFHPTFACLFLYAGAETAVCSWLVTYLTTGADFSAFEASAVTGVIWASLFVGRQLCARMARTVSVKRLLLTLMPGGALCVLALPHLRGIAVWAGAALLGLCLSGIWPLVASKLLDDPEYDGGTTLSLAFLFSFCANTMIPYGIGMVADCAGLSVALTVNGGVFALLYLVYYFTNGRMSSAPSSKETVEIIK